MIAILGENRSDAETLRVLVRRLLTKPNVKITPKGFNGCSELCRKGASHLRDFARRGYRWFVISHDADRNQPGAVYQKVIDNVVSPAGVQTSSCVVVPVEELEAWLIADDAAINKVIPSLVIPAVTHPETVSSPKEWLERQSAGAKSKPLYIHSIHNPKVATYLHFEIVACKCPSIKPLITFIRGI